MNNNEPSENDESKIIFIENGNKKEDKKRALFNLCSAIKELFNENEK